MRTTRRTFMKLCAALGLVSAVPIGKDVAGTQIDYFTGGLAIWDTALSDKEIAALGKGVSPTLVRPENLQHYYPAR